MTAASPVTAEAPTPDDVFGMLFDRGSRADRDSSGTVRVATGRAHGEPLTAFVVDRRVRGGALGEADCEVVAAAIDAAAAGAHAVVGVWASGGARLDEGVRSLEGMGRVFAATVRASGQIPQISVIVGPAAGGAAYGPALSDIVIMSEEGRAFITGPDVVAAVTGERVTMSELGGPDAHARRSGLVHRTAVDTADALAQARRLVQLLGVRVQPAPAVGPQPQLEGVLPSSAKRAYDVHRVVDGLLDRGSYLELQPGWAPNLVIALGRLQGRQVGVVANNPIRKAGCLDSAAAEKAARFVRMCDAFGVPLVVLVDVPGYLPGVAQEWDGVIRRGSKLLHAFAAATVPRVTVILRRSFGGAYIAMNSRALGADAVLAWPDAEVAVMDAGAAVGILHRRTLANAGDAYDAVLADLVQRHRAGIGHLDAAMQCGAVDRIVRPEDTAAAVLAALSERERSGRVDATTRPSPTNIQL